MGVYLDSRTIELLLNGVWTDITADVVSPIRCNWGMSGNGVLDRVAVPGSLSFDVNNVTQKYTPGSATASPYFVRGVVVRLTVTYEGEPYVRFRGKMNEAPIQSGTWGTRRASLRCSDWMQIASTDPLVLLQSYASKRADEGIQIILGQMSTQPQATLLAMTTDIFALIFDTIKNKTKALTEFSKLIMSEFGMLYLRKDRLYGETLVVEGRHDRDAGASFMSIPISRDNSVPLLLEDGDELLLEDGTPLLLNESTTYDFDNTMQSLDVVYGSEFHNYVSVRNYPREIGNTVSVLFKLNAPIELAAGETKTNILGSFVDPGGGGTQINGNTMITPVINTDYKMFANSDGTGTDLTANLTVTAEYNPAGVIYTLHNTGGTTGYVTTLQARGYPVKIYNPVEQWDQDDASILQNGYSELIVDQRYSPTIMPNVGLAQVLLAQEKDAKTMVNKLSGLANTNHELMASFLVGDVGSLIQVIETQTGTNTPYYIQGVNFEIGLNGIVTFTWLLREALSLSSQYWELETVGYGELEVTTFVGY